MKPRGMSQNALLLVAGDGFFCFGWWAGGQYCAVSITLQSFSTVITRAGMYVETKHTGCLSHRTHVVMAYFHL